MNIYTLISNGQTLGYLTCCHGIKCALERDYHQYFLVSDFTPSFQLAAELFFQEEINLEKHILWE
jgi:hypothetical protein